MTAPTAACARHNPTPDRGMYFILRLTQLIVRPDSRSGVLRYKIVPKCLLPGPFGHSGVGGNPGVARPVRSYNPVLTYPCQPPRVSDSYSPQSLPGRSLTLTEPSPANPGPDSPAVMLYDECHLPALDPRLRAPLSSLSNCRPRSFSWPPYPASRSPETDSATAAAPEAGVPDAPRYLNVSSGESGELAVSGEAPSSDGGSEIAGYEVQWTLLQGRGYRAPNREVTPC